MQRVLSHVRRAVYDYAMIKTGDRIAVGVSGGKDSVTLALALNNLKIFYPEKFEIVPIMLDMGFENGDFSELSSFFEKNGMNLQIIKTNIAEILFDIRKESNPCSLCSKLRRGALNDAAKDAGCNKVALGHNNDDAVETYMLCLFYEGRAHSFSPVTYLDRKDITVIRPLVYMPEKDIRSFVKKNNIPIVKNPCPADGYTKRQEIKDLLISLSKENHGLRERIFTAMINSLEPWKR